MLGVPDQPAHWGISSAGRAPALQAGGRRFDPVILHHRHGVINHSVIEHSLMGGSVRFGSRLERCAQRSSVDAGVNQRSEELRGCSLKIHRVESALPVWPLAYAGGAVPATN
jgi:hypothetical protein